MDSSIKMEDGKGHQEIKGNLKVNTNTECLVKTHICKVSLKEIMM